MDLKTKRKRMFPRIISHLSVMIIFCVCILTPNLSPESSDTGADQAHVLYEIGVLPAYDGVYLAKTTLPQDAANAVQRMLGSGNAEDIRNFYRYLSLEEAPNFTFPQEKESLTETELYGYLLRALGFSVADEAALAKAEEVGFGFLREVRDSGEPLTNGILATLLYEAMFVRPDNPENYTTARILAYLNSDFKDILIEHGLYDNIPEKYLPLFNSGIYKQDSFAVLPGEDGRNEWTAVYLAADSDYITTYIASLLGDGWLLEGTYLEEGETSATIELLYKPLPEDSSKEIAVAIRYDASGTVEMALFLD